MWTHYSEESPYWWLKRRLIDDKKGPAVSYSKGGLIPSNMIFFIDDKEEV